jgi:hypothetical protein
MRATAALKPKSKFSLFTPFYRRWLDFFKQNLSNFLKEIYPEYSPDFNR